MDSLFDLGQNNNLLYVIRSNHMAALNNALMDFLFQV